MDKAAKIELAKELRESGLSYREIGRRTGVTGGTIKRWLEPTANEKHCQRLREYRQTDKGREYLKKYNQSDCSRKAARKYHESNNHPETTYFIGSPDCGRVIIGTTVNWKSRICGSYNKSLVPLRLLGMTRLPEKMIHERFKHLQVPGYSCEVFHLTPELQAFINEHCWPQLFRWSECFVGQDDTQAEE